MPNSLDRGFRSEFLAQTTHADLDDVGARVEVVAPDLGEQALAADNLARVFNEMVKQPELPVRKVGDHSPEPRLSPG